jgi:ketosteroid isomerase-like protein
MSEERMEVLRRVYEAFDSGEVDAAAEVMHPDIEVHEPPELPDADVWRGRTGFKEVVRKLSSSFHELRFQPDEFISAGDRVLVTVRWSGRGSLSGAETGTALFHVWSFRGDRPSRLEAYLDERTARQAAGLSE